MFIAEINTNNKVTEVKEVGELYKGNGIKINSFDFKLMGTSYSGGNFIGYYITLTVDKSTITADGVDKAVITAKTFNYDDTPATDYTTGIIFDVNGTQQTVAPVNGEATIEFKSSIAGNFTIKTVNDVIRNGEVTIIAS
jgi:hypothetical protein